MADATYRNAEEDDISLILEFIKKLADYEGRLDEVTATEEDLSRWIFDEGIAEVIFVLEDGKEVGFALFYKTFSTYIAKINIHLEDMFVEPAYRGKGYGNGIEYVHKAEEVLELAQRILDNGEYEELSKKGREYVKSNDWEAITDKFENAMKNLLR